MDWIEQLTGLDPDGGNGTLELLIAAVTAFITVMVWRVARRRRARGGQRDRDGR